MDLGASASASATNDGTLWGSNSGGGTTGDASYNNYTTTGGSSYTDYSSSGGILYNRGASSNRDRGVWRLVHAEGHVLFPGSDHLETFAVFDRVVV